MAIEEVMISSSCETHTWEMHQIFRAGLGLTVLNVQLCKQSKFSSFRFSGSGSLSVMFAWHCQQQLRSDAVRQWLLMCGPEAL